MVDDVEPVLDLWRAHVTPERGCRSIRNCGAVAQFQRRSSAMAALINGSIPLCRRATVVVVGSWM